MVNEQAAGPLGARWCPGEHDHRGAFGIGPGDGVDQVEGAGPVGDGGDAQAAVEANRGVGGEPDRRLVAERVEG